MLCQLSLQGFGASTCKGQASALLSHVSAVGCTNTSAHQISFGFAALPQFLAGRCSSNCAHLKVFFISQSSTSRLQAAHSLLVPLQESRDCFPHPTATNFRGPGVCDEHPPTHSWYLQQWGNSASFLLILNFYYILSANHCSIYF